MAATEENSFKRLQEEQENQHASPPPEIENNIMGSMRVAHFMGNIVELYLPRVFDLILALFGSKKEEEEKKTEEEIDTKNSDSDNAPEGNAISDELSDLD